MMGYKGVVVRRRRNLFFIFLFSFSFFKKHREWRDNVCSEERISEYFCSVYLYPPHWLDLFLLILMRETSFVVNIFVGKNMRVSFFFL